MNDIPSLSHLNPTIGRIQIPRPTADRIASPLSPAGDRVEVSQAAQLLAKLADMPDIRQDLVDRVQTQLQHGNYESDAKLTAALEALTEDL